jgi:hypothetical protein
MTALAKYQRLKEQLNIDDNSFDTASKDQMSSKIVEFLSFAKKVEPLITTFKMNLAKQLTMKHHSIVGYADLAKIIDRYEELNLTQY